MTENAEGGWIDPETPGSAHTTTARRARQYHPPKVPPKPHNITKDRLKRLKHAKGGTLPPTAAPTPAPPPTVAPTMAPTTDHEVLSEHTLVMSDEFNTPGRTFQDGLDPLWTALDKNDYTNNALHYYGSDQIFTDNQGNLNVRTSADKTTVVGFNDVTLKSSR